MWLTYIHIDVCPAGVGGGDLDVTSIYQMRHHIIIPISQESVLSSIPLSSNQENPCYYLLLLAKQYWGDYSWFWLFLPISCVLTLTVKLNACMYFECVFIHRWILMASTKTVNLYAYIISNITMIFVFKRSYPLNPIWLDSCDAI